MSDSNASITRRQFCAGACQVASCATLATLVSACGGAESPTGPDGVPVTLGTIAGRFANNRVQATVAGTALASVGGAALVESTAGVFLVARTSDTSFMTIDGVCTHEGCTVNSIDGDTYVCPCHGSRYNRTGQVQQGPARSNLRQYGNTFADGVVTITL